MFFNVRTKSCTLHLDLVGIRFYRFYRFYPVGNQCNVPFQNCFTGLNLKTMETQPEKPSKMVQSTQEEIDYIGEKLNVEFEVVTNFFGDGDMNFVANITLTNSGDSQVQASGDWAIFFFNFRKIDRDFGTKNNDMETGGQFDVDPVNGQLYTLTPNGDFRGLNPGQSVSVIYKAQDAIAAKSDVLPNWYVASAKTQARVLKSTKGYDASFVKPFDKPWLWKRRQNDVYNPWNPVERYDHQEVEDLGKAVNPIIPTPKQFDVHDDAGTVVFDPSTWVVVADQSLRREVAHITGEQNIAHVYFCNILGSFL